MCWGYGPKKAKRKKKKNICMTGSLCCIVEIDRTLQINYNKKIKIIKKKIFYFLQLHSLVAFGSSWARGRISSAAVAYATARATPHLSCICNLCCSLQQGHVLYPLSKVRDQPAPSWRQLWVLNPLSHNANPWKYLLNEYYDVWDLLWNDRGSGSA